jgi:hypothetical protein
VYVIISNTFAVDVREVGVYDERVPRGFSDEEDSMEKSECAVRQAEHGEVIVACELCEKVAVLKELSTGFYCAECAEEYGGGSDESDRQAERRQMGLVNF